MSPRVQDTVSSYITAATDYTASFSLAQVALKVVDAGLTAVEGIISTVGHGEESCLVSGVRKVHSTANTIRLSGLKKAGTAKAKKIEEGSILEAIIFLFGIPVLIESLGFKLRKNETEMETVYEDEVSRVEVNQEEVEEPVVVDTADTEEVEESVEVATTYSRTLRTRKVENIVDDSV